LLSEVVIFLDLFLNSQVKIKSVVSYLFDIEYQESMTQNLYRWWSWCWRIYICQIIRSISWLNNSPFYGKSWIKRWLLIDLFKKRFVKCFCFRNYDIVVDDIIFIQKKVVEQLIRLW